MSRFHTKTHLSQDDLPRNHPFKNNRCCGYEKPLTLLESEQSALCAKRQQEKIKEFQLSVSLYTDGSGSSRGHCPTPRPTSYVVVPYTVLHGYSEYVLPLTRTCCSYKSSTLPLRNSGRRPRTPGFSDIRF